MAAPSTSVATGPNATDNPLAISLLLGLLVIIGLFGVKNPKVPETIEATIA